MDTKDTTFNKPTFQITQLDTTQDFATLEIEPLEAGYGHTLGNALRRVLLTSLPGYAITSVKIDGVDHQFSTLEGMSEDIVDFILNLKQVRVASTLQREGTASIHVKNKTEITAEDIECEGGFEVVNKDLMLATLNKKTDFNIEMTIGYGIGYSMAEERKNSEIGLIAIDALFSPIVRVSYKVEATRVGRRTDFDKVIMKIWTNGTIEPKQALEEAARILVKKFTQVYNPVIVEEEEPEEILTPEEREILRLTVEELDLPTRIANALRKGGYATVGDLIETDPTDIKKVKNLGEKSIETIQNALQQKNVSLKEK